MIGMIRNFLLWEGNLVHCGGDRGDTEFSVMGGQSGALCRWIGVVIGVLRNFLLWEGNLGLCGQP